MATQEGDPSDPVAGALAEAHQHGAEAWPTAQISLDDFRSAVLARARVPVTLAALAAMKLDELYLAAACALGDTGAILAFEHEFFGEVERLFPARSYGEALLDDARQNLRERLFVTTADRPAGIGNYGGRGSLRRWFRLALTHHTLNLKRSEARAPTPMDVSSDQTLLARADPELLYLRERYSSEFRAAAEEAVGRLAAADRLVLQHHYLERLGIDAIAAIHGIHRVTAARRVNAAREELVRLVRQALTERLQVDDAELRSILRLLPTQFSMSFRRVLGGVAT